MDKKSDQNCKNCPHGDRCSEIYEKMGASECENVTVPVSIAFLLPIIVLIITVAVFKHCCKDCFQSSTLESVAALIFGLIAAFISVCIAKLALRK